MPSLSKMSWIYNRYRFADCISRCCENLQSCTVQKLASHSGSVELFVFKNAEKSQEEKGPDDGDNIRTFDVKEALSGKFWKHQKPIEIPVKTTPA